MISTSDKRASLFENNSDLKDASFSSYINENNTMLKLTHPPQINTKKKIEDGEIGIFGAEKYFKGAMDEQLPRTPRSLKPPIYPSKTPQEKDDQEPPKPKTGSVTPSVRSESSYNSRSGLLVNGGNRRLPPSKKEKTTSVKTLLASLGCNCNDQASVKITENKLHVKDLAKPPTKGGHDFDNNKNIMNTKKDDCFAFPVLRSRSMTKTLVPQEEEVDITRDKTRKDSMEVFGSPIMEKGKKSFSLERKLTMLNWDGVTPKAENIDLLINGPDLNDAGSDASSDLFEIESFSTNGNNTFLARQVSTGRSIASNAPSEASIAWSVVTASVAGFSIVSHDYEDTRTTKTHNIKVGSTTGILSGCNSHKSVRVAGEHHVVVSGGGDKAAVMVGATTKDQRCRLDSIVPRMKLQPETKPMMMSSIARAHSPRASHHLYIQ